MRNRVDIGRCKNSAARMIELEEPGSTYSWYVVAVVAVVAVVVLTNDDDPISPKRVATYLQLDVVATHTGINSTHM